jgi:hypothetical protein
VNGLESPSAESRNAFVEALESYQQALAVLKLQPESPERDLRELELRQAAYILLRITKGFSSPEAIEAAEYANALAEKSGNLPQLSTWVRSRCLPAIISGHLTTGISIADRALERALQVGNPASLADVYTLQMIARYWAGDLAGAEEHFKKGREFFNDANFRQGTALW